MCNLLLGRRYLLATFFLQNPYSEYKINKNFIMPCIYFKKKFVIDAKKPYLCNI